MEIYSDTSLPQETRKISKIKDLTLHLNGLGKEKKKKPKLVEEKK